MRSFEWSEQFVTGIEIVDAQHRGLVDLINAYGDKLTQGDLEPEDHAEMVHDLSAYADLHFSDEDRLAVERGVDPRHLAAHRQDHQRFLADLDVAERRVASGAQEAPALLLDLLVHWLAYHILVQDQNMARQIEAIARGASPAEAYEQQQRAAASETEPLVVALLGLLQQVSTQNRALQELNETLESKVGERTRALSEANRLLEVLAMTDALTGLPNRRSGLARLGMLWSEATEGGTPLSVLMIDGDGFKQVNDTHGHAAGDAVLCRLAQVLSENVRTDDVVCRLGGDEFLVVCPKTDEAGARRVAEALVAAVGASVLHVDGVPLRQSVSVGVASRAPGMGGHEALLRAADQAVYAAKAAGRGCVRGPSDLVAGD